MAIRIWEKPLYNCNSNDIYFRKRMSNKRFYAVLFVFYFQNVKEITLKPRKKLKPLSNI